MSELTHLDVLFIGGPCDLQVMQMRQPLRSTFVYASPRETPGKTQEFQTFKIGTTEYVLKEVVGRLRFRKLPYWDVYVWDQAPGDFLEYYMPRYAGKLAEITPHRVEHVPVGYMIRERQDRLGLSDVQVAHRIGSGLARYQSIIYGGVTPSDAELVKISKVLGSDFTKV
jgi:hypothetical protein